MELSRHAQVLWRFRVIIVAGVLAGLVLAIGTLFSVSSSGLKWREQLEYKSSSTLFVTQPGFPWGRANLPTASDGAPASATAPDQNFAEPARFAGLASIYSFLVRGEEVRALIPGHPSDAQIAAEPFVSSTERERRHAAADRSRHDREDAARGAAAQRELDQGAHDLHRAPAARLEDRERAARRHPGPEPAERRHHRQAAVDDRRHRGVPALRDRRRRAAPTSSRT